MQPDPAISATPAPAGAAGTKRPWWGRYTLAEDEGGEWEIGPLTLSVQRGASEWRVGWEALDPQGDGIAQRQSTRCPLAAAELPSGRQVARFAVHATTPELVLAPVLPDRAVVARPEQRLHLLGGEDVALFVAMPVWVRLLVEGERPLIELPTQRLAETWFGASPRSGEVCYATRTSARLQPHSLTPRPHVAVCPVHLSNRSPAPLLIERLSLPVPHLDLWWHRERGLWTRGIEVERAADGTLASLRLADGPPAAVLGASHVAAARLPEPKLGLVRALEALLG